MVAKKKTTQKRKQTAKSRNVTYKTFKVASDFPIFFEPRITRQTFYWSALLLFIIIMQLIIIAINVNATITLDSISTL